MIQDSHLLLLEMKKTMQFSGQSVYEHCVSVLEYYRDLYLLLPSGKLDFHGVKLPDWLLEFFDFFQADFQSRRWNVVTFYYLLFHDCGKPFCRVVEEGNSIHFPGHENVSKEVFFALRDPFWLRMPQIVVEDIGFLIQNDMFCHRINKDNYQNLHYLPFWPILLLAAFAEIFSNSRMFGGIDSDSFKIKFKRISKWGKKAFDHHLAYGYRHDLSFLQSRGLSPKE